MLKQHHSEIEEQHPNLGNYKDGTNREACLKEVRREVIGTDWIGKETVYPIDLRCSKTVGGTHFSKICNAIGIKAYGYHWRYVIEKRPKRIIENHNGYVDVESKLGEGSVFKIGLPV